MPHAFRVTGEGDARLLNITTPGHERFVRAAGDPAGGAGFPYSPRRPHAAFLAAAETYGTEVLGPPPSLD